MKNVKKLFILFICLLTLVGCSKNKEPEIVYDYDYIDYLDVEFIGPDGYAAMDINVRDFTASEFDNEADYIQVKKIMASIYQNIAYSQNEMLSNGDIIQIGISSTFDTAVCGDININLQPYEFTVSGLNPPKELDLYDQQNVVFYGLEGTSKVYYYYPTNSGISKEAKENLDYVISVDDDKVAKDKTVLALEAKFSDEFLASKRQYGTLIRYFGYNGFVVEATAERTLKTVVNENALEKIDKAVLRSELEKHIKTDDMGKYELKQIMCIQKTEIPFYYYVVALFKNDANNEVYIKYSCEMAYVNNQLVVYSFNKESTTDKNYAETAYGDAEIMYKFEIFELPPEEVQAETAETEETKTTEEKAG